MPVVIPRCARSFGWKSIFIQIIHHMKRRAFFTVAQPMDMPFKFAKIFGKCDLRFLADSLVAKNQNVVFEKSVVNPGDCSSVQWFREIEIKSFSAHERRQRLK